jgi:ABC-type bacteriocin/lantibiotic exporter with double-glycine peptidase domain
MENSLICTKRFFELIKLPYTTAFLREKLLTHPEPESLLSISDTLAEYKVESLALQIGADKLDQLPLPCVVQIKGDRHPFFSCLSSVDKGGIEYLDIEGRTTLTHTPTIFINGFELPAAYKVEDLKYVLQKRINTAPAVTIFNRDE